jgi:cytochrome c oxidase subunit 2
MVRTRPSLIALAILALPALGDGQGTQADPRVIHVVAERFSFTPAEITVDEGAVLELRIMSDDTSHGFRLIGPDGFDLQVPKRGRGDVRIRYEAMVPGSYTFECSRVCGAGHDFMRGRLRVRAR